MSSAPTQYNLLARMMHWVSAVVIIGMFAVGVWMVDLSYYSSWYHTAPHWHKSVGLLLAGLTIFRVAWKLVTVSPVVDGSGLERFMAKVAHLFIYLDMVVLFVSGYLISTADGRGIDIFDWVTIPGAGVLFEGQADLAGLVHFYSAWALIITAVIHALAALKHHFINKDNTLRKMIGVS